MTFLKIVKLFYSINIYILIRKKTLNDKVIKVHEPTLLIKITMQQIMPILQANTNSWHKF